MKNTDQIPNQEGFTLIELLIVVAIVGVLAAVAIPSYQSYIINARTSEIVAALSPYQTAVANCYQTQGSFTNCNGGTNGVPVSQTFHHVASVTVAAGVITARAVESGVPAAMQSGTIIATPTDSNHNGSVTWKLSGTLVQYTSQ